MATHPLSLVLCPPQMRADLDLLRAAVEGDWRALAIAPAAAQADDNLLLLACRNWPVAVPHSTLEARADVQVLRPSGETCTIGRADVWLAATAVLGEVARTWGRLPGASLVLEDPPMKKASGMCIMPWGLRLRAVTLADAAGTPRRAPGLTLVRSLR